MIEVENSKQLPELFTVQRRLNSETVKRPFDYVKASPCP